MRRNTLFRLIGVTVIVVVGVSSAAFWQLGGAIEFSEAISRESTVYNSLTAEDEAISREFTLSNASEGLVFEDVVSREFTLSNVLGAEFDEAISREFTLSNAQTGPVVFVDSVSREFTLYRPPPDLTIEVVDAPAEGLTRSPFEVAWRVKRR